jgi:hypothetical protein
MARKPRCLILCLLLSPVCPFAQSQTSTGQPLGQGLNAHQAVPIQVHDTNRDPTLCGSDIRLKFLPNLVATVGDPFSEQVGTFLICNGQYVQDYGSRIYWGDGGNDPMTVWEPFWEGRIQATHTFSKEGVVKISGHIGAMCYGKPFYGNPGPVAFPDLSCGKGEVTVYESIPVTSFSVTCDVADPCKKIKGGGTTQLKGMVALKHPSTGIGALIRTSVLFPFTPAKTQPYFIISKGHDSGTFTISTEKETTPTDVLIYVYSGGNTLAEKVVVIP